MTWEEMPDCRLPELKIVNFQFSIVSGWLKLARAGSKVLADFNCHAVQFC